MSDVDEVEEPAGIVDGVAELDEDENEVVAELEALVVAEVDVTEVRDGEDEFDEVDEEMLAVVGGTDALDDDATCSERLFVEGIEEELAAASVLETVGVDMSL